MSDCICPGELVVRRSRWSMYSICVGLVVAADSQECTVLWVTQDDTKVGTHSLDALLIVNENLDLELEDRCLPSV